MGSQIAGHNTEQQTNLYMNTERAIPVSSHRNETFFIFFNFIYI